MNFHRSGASSQKNFEMSHYLGRVAAISVEAGHLGGAPGRIRTCDTGFRRAVLYPLSYEGNGLEAYRPAGGLP